MKVGDPEALIMLERTLPGELDGVLDRLVREDPERLADALRIALAVYHGDEPGPECDEEERNHATSRKARHGTSPT